MSREVLVVIGTGGMGRAIARRSGSGRKVLLADFDESALAAVSEELRGEGHDVTAKTVDVGDRDSVHALASAAAGLGPVARIAHTAGLSPTQAPARTILRVDLLGTALVLEAFGEVVAAGGAAVVVASMAGHMAAGLDAAVERDLAATPVQDLLDLPFLADVATGDPGTAYAIAKRANLLRVQAAAGSWGRRKARVNSISPGVVSTPMGQQELQSENGEQMRAMIAMSGTGRVGTPADIAAAAAFLLGAEADFITGTDLLVDGGVVAAVRSMPEIGAS